MVPHQQRGLASRVTLFLAFFYEPPVFSRFPERNFRFLYSSHSGVTCHPQADAVGSVLPRRSKAAPKSGLLAGFCERLLLHFLHEVSRARRSRSGRGWPAGLGRYSRSASPVLWT